MLSLDPNNLLEVRSVSKVYSRSAKGKRAILNGHIRAALFGRGKQTPKKMSADEFLAVNDVSLTLARGEAVGLMGLNGAGKSTLLKMIAGQILPDQGEIRINGKMSSMIEMSSGLLPNATGLENIRRKAGLMGVPTEELEQLTIEVKDFSELGSILESPVSTYSSGMKARLGFAIATFIKPDIMLIDEALAVGDFRFRQKCLRRINQIRDHSSFIMVSHSGNDIAKFCDKVVVLEDGKIVFSGEVKEGVDYYYQRYQSLEEESNKTAVANVSSPVETEKAILPFLHPLYENTDAISNLNVSINDSKKSECLNVKAGDKITVDIAFDLTEESSRLHVGMPIWNEDGVLICAFSSRVDEVEMSTCENGTTTISLTFDISYFNPDVYHMVLAVIDGNEFLYRQPILNFEVRPSTTGYWGLICLPGEWQSGESRV
jgi:ABC-type polysaccharide/polyol phosphate transport system ATPase subunit